MSTTKMASLTILEKEGKILLIRRFNTGFADGLYTLPSGKVDENESFTQAAIRETFEEVNAEIEAPDLKSVHIMSEKPDNEDGEWIHHFFLAKKWRGEIKNMETHKCDDIQWFDIERLPNNILPFVKDAIEKIYNNCHYSERGWDK